MELFSFLILCRSFFRFNTFDLEIEVNLLFRVSQISRASFNPMINPNAQVEKVELRKADGALSLTTQAQYECWILDWLCISSTKYKNSTVCHVGNQKVITTKRYHDSVKKIYIHTRKPLTTTFLLYNFVFTINFLTTYLQEINPNLTLN